jgi:tRNA G10  N-methylase Trm11
MSFKKHLYIFDYHHTERDLCRLESKYVFDEEVGEKLLYSDTSFHPSSSAFIKKRLDIMAASQTYEALLPQIEETGISAEGFKVEYLIFDSDDTRYVERLDKMRDVGYRIEGIPDYHSPKSVYALCHHQGYWLFGQLIKDSFDWHKHKQKPRSYSNSITVGIAKALINIAAQGQKSVRLLDACCGVGTIMLEASYVGYSIEGCDFNWKICADARENIAYFDYSAAIYCADIGDIDKRYDAAIVDLPYNLLSDASEADIAHIIVSAGKLADRLVIVSTSDISAVIHQAGFGVASHCEVRKKGKRNFTRKIWVCEKTLK